MVENKYIEKMKHYILSNTPLEFEYEEYRYQEITNHLKSSQINEDTKEIVVAVYSLFYTSLLYHKKASTNEIHQEYRILIGDYLSSYVAELLFKNKYFELLKIFSIDSKKLMLRFLNNLDDDNILLNNILKYFNI